MESYPYSVKEGQWYINLNPGRLFVQQPPKKVKESRGSFKLWCQHLQQGKTTITPQDIIKSNMTKTSMHPSLKIHTTQNQHIHTKASFSRLLWHLAWKQWDYSGRMGMDRKAKKMAEVKSIVKDTKKETRRGKWRDYGGLSHAHTGSDETKHSTIKADMHY